MLQRQIEGSRFPCNTSECIFLQYDQQAHSVSHVAGKEICSFISDNERNVDVRTIASFGEEWKKFGNFSDEDIKKIGEQYFDIISEKMLNDNSVVLDLGCGSGRWSMYMSHNVKFVEAVDPSCAIFGAAENFGEIPNIRWTQASVDSIPFQNDSFDFILCLGVLHHLPNTQEAILKVADKLKPGGFFLLYLYYALENRGLFYKSIFQLSQWITQFTSSLSQHTKMLVCDILALTVYWPMVTLVRFLKWAFPRTYWYQKLPLSYYHDKSFHIMRNDALDRFGTPLQSRFTKEEIRSMMEKAGFTDTIFSQNAPYWHVVGRKRA